MTGESSGMFEMTPVHSDSFVMAVLAIFPEALDPNKQRGTFRCDLCKDALICKSFTESHQREREKINY